MASVLRVVSNAQKLLLRTVNCDVNKKIKPNWCHLNKKKIMANNKRRKFILKSLTIASNSCLRQLLVIKSRTFLPKTCIWKLFSMSTKDFSYFLDGKSSQGKVLNEWEEALIRPITISKSTLNKSTKFKR